jgi:gliding motility-associated-like protein
MKICYPAILLCLLPAFSLWAQPANDNCAQPFDIPRSANWCSKVAEFTNERATPSGYDGANCFGNASNDVWFTFTPIATDVTITVIGRTADGGGGSIQRPEVALYYGTCGGTINEQECGSDVSGNNIIEIYKGGLAVGETYYIRVQGRGGRMGTFQLCINNYNPPVEPGSDCVISSLLCDKSPFAVQQVRGAGNDPREANGAPCFENGSPGNVESNSTWFTWTALNAGNLTFTLTPLNPTDDIDFIVYELPQGALDCRNKRIVRCMASGDFRFPSRCMGPTGLRNGSTDDSEPAGCNNPRQDNFLAPLPMQAGRTYAIMINNFSETGNGFRMEFGGTGEFQGPQADFTSSEADSTICVGQPITFTDASSFALGSIMKYEWSFGPTASMTTSDQKGPQTVSFNKAGTKSIILTITSDKGCVVTKIKTIKVECCPDHFSAAAGTVRNATCGENNGAIDLNITTQYPPYSYLWSDSTTTEDLANLRPGRYTVTVTDQATCDTVLNFTIPTSAAIQLDTVLKRPTCGGGVDGAITLNVTGGKPPYQFNWQNQGFQPGNTLANIPRGDYTVTVRDSTNCDTTLTIALRELELRLNPAVQAVTPPTCNGAANGSIRVEVTNGLGPFQYNFNTGGGFQSANSLTGLRAGMYRVDVQDRNQCVGSFDFNIEDFPALALRFDSTDASCNGVADGRVRALASGGVVPYQFVWNTGARADSIRNLADGSYTVTVTDSNQCTISGTVVIREPAPVLVNLVSTKDVTCNGDTTGVITVAGSGGTRPYEFSLGNNIFQSDSTFRQVRAGSYTITIEDAGGCTNTTTALINQPSPLLVDAGPDTTINLGESIDLQAIANSGKVSWEWNPKETLSCTDCPNPTASPRNTITYLVTATNEDTCDVTDEITITVNKVRPVFIPNAFSPNVDGTNDRFTLFGGPAAEIITRLRVFDRWGNLLFDGSNLALGQESLGWDGTFKGKPMGTGVYTYMAEVRFIDGEVLLYEGDITIVR